VKIDGLPPSSFNINDFAGQLGLKDGQKIIGRIVRSGPEEVWLQLAGKTVVAKLEGAPLSQGTLVLLGVSLTRGDRIELKVMENLAPPAAGGADTGLSDSSGAAQIRSLIAAVLKESGLGDSAQNLERVAGDIKAVVSQYQQILDPKVFTFLLGKNWPVTPGTVLFSWLYQDQELREMLWNLLDRSPWVRNDPALLPKVLDLGAKEFSDASKSGVNPDEPIMQPGSSGFSDASEPGVNPDEPIMQPGSSGFSDASKSGVNPDESIMQPGSSGFLDASKSGVNPDEPIMQPGSSGFLDASEPGVKPDESIMQPGSSELREPQTSDKTTYSPAEIGKLRAALEQSLRLEKADHQQDRLDGAEALVPFLVRTPEQKLREYIVKWKEKSRQTGGGAKEEAVRLVIPTENMGNITVQMLVSSKMVRIGLKVMSDSVRNYITRHLSDLKRTVGPEARIAVSTVATKSETESRMDLWM
jgi:hypothetical protein